MSNCKAEIQCSKVKRISVKIIGVCSLLVACGWAVFSYMLLAFNYGIREAFGGSSLPPEYMLFEWVFPVVVTLPTLYLLLIFLYAFSIFNFMKYKMFLIGGQPLFFIVILRACFLAWERDTYLVIAFYVFSTFVFWVLSYLVHCLKKSYD